MTRCAVLLPLLLLGGCKALVREGDVVGYHPDLPPRAEHAPYDTTYTLYALDPDAQPAYVTIELPKGTPIGYRREPNGALVAVAGEQVTPIPDERAMWRYTPTPRSRVRQFAVKTRDTGESVVSALILTPFLVWAIVSGGEVP